MFSAQCKATQHDVVIRHICTNQATERTRTVHELLLEADELLSVDDQKVGDSEIQSHVHYELEDLENLLLCLHHHQTVLLLGRLLQVYDCT